MSSILPGFVSHRRYVVASVTDGTISRKVSPLPLSTAARPAFPPDRLASTGYAVPLISNPDLPARLDGQLPLAGGKPLTAGTPVRKNRTGRQKGSRVGVRDGSRRDSCGDDLPRGTNCATYGLRSYATTQVDSA